MSDQLGSASVIASASGSAQEQYFYYPFGGMQSSVGSDPNHYKFNGKEWDSESGLDNFGARFDSSSLGRFMTPDWAGKPITVPYAKFGDPQSLNLYAYVENSPIDRIDPDGHVTSGDFRCPDQRHCVDQSPAVGDSCDNTAGTCYTGDRSNAFILLAAENLSYTATILGQKVPVTIVGETAEAQKAIRGRLDAALVTSIDTPTRCPHRT